MLPQTASAFLPAFGRNVAVSLSRAEGTDDEITRKMIQEMQALTREGEHSDRIRAATADAIAGATDERERMERIFWYIKHRVKFVGDEEYTRPFDFHDWYADEFLIPPADLLAMSEPADDCDGFSMLTAAMLRAAGIKAAFKTVAASRETPDRYSHVYCVAIDSRGRRIPLDTSHGPKPDTEVQPTWKAKIWPIEPQPLVNVSGGLGDWSDLLQDAFKIGLQDIAAPILTGRYSNPTPAPGTYIQRTGVDPRTGKQTSETYYGQQPGASDLAFPGVSAGGSGVWVLGGVALLAVLLIAGKR